MMSKSHLQCSVRKIVTLIIIFMICVLLKEIFFDVSIADSGNDFKRHTNHIYNSNTLVNSIISQKPTSKQQTSFFLSLSYFEQLTCATRNLLSAGGIAQNLGAKLVIPFLLRSRLYGIPDLIPSQEVPDIFYPLHTIYDMDRLNQTFHLMSNTYLTDFEDFIYNAPRELVVFDLIHRQLAPKEFGLTERAISKIKRMMDAYSYKIFDCAPIVFHDNQPLVERIELMLRIHTRRFGVEEFVIKDYVCFSPYVDITTDEIMEFIGRNPRSIIFTQFRGCAYHSCDINAPHKMSSPFRNRILYHSNHTQPLPHIRDIVIPLSNAIKSIAMQYLHKIDLFTPFISVHIRIEKLSRINDKFNGHTACCFEILDALLKSLKWRYFNHTLLVTDIGDYGSDACFDKVCLPHSRKVKRMLKEMQLVQHSFNPRVTGSSENPALASLVEMHMLAMGERLIVVGLGSFKHQIITHFLKSNSANNLYHICTEDGNVLNEFSDLNKNCWKDNG